MATGGLEKDLQQKIARLGLSIPVKQKISWLSDNEVVSVLAALLGRYDPSWFWETSSLSLQANRKQAIRYLRLLDIAHLASGPADLATGSKRLLRLLCALFEKLERKHGVSLYQKPKQVLKPRPRSAAPAGGSGGRDHTDKENGPGSSLAPARSRSGGPVVKHVARTSSASTDSSRVRSKPPQRARTSSVPSSAIAIPTTSAPSTDVPTSSTSITASTSTAVPQLVARHSVVSLAAADVKLDKGTVAPPNVPASVGNIDLAGGGNQSVSSSTREVLLSLQKQINSIQRNIESTARHQDQLRGQQLSLSKNLQDMWLHYERNLKLLHQLSEADSGDLANAGQVSIPEVTAAALASGDSTYEPAAHGSVYPSSSVLRSTSGISPPRISPSAHKHDHQYASAVSKDLLLSSEATEEDQQRDAANHPREHSLQGGVGLAHVVLAETTGGLDPSLQSHQHRKMIPPYDAQPTPASHTDVHAPAPLQFAELDAAYLERRLQRVLRRSELFLERDRLLQTRISNLRTL